MQSNWLQNTLQNSVRQGTFGIHIVPDNKLYLSRGKHSGITSVKTVNTHYFSEGQLGFLQISSSLQTSVARSTFNVKLQKPWA
jgi:hypothetical protein